MTNNSTHDEEPQISGTNIVWEGDPNAGIFFYNGSNGITTRLTSNGWYPQISGSNVVWEGWDGNDLEIFFYNGSTGITTQLTNNDYPDTSPQISGSNIVWVGWLDNQTQKEIFMAVPCQYRLAGDFNEDCKVDFNDFSLMAQNWLIDCIGEPSNPACVSK